MVLRAAQARRIATATAFGGGGLTLLGASTIALLYLQTRIATRTIGFTTWRRPEVDGVHGSGEGTPVRLVMMGDSTAAGFAVSDALQTPACLIASGLSAAADRPVRLRDVARVGATSRDLRAQLDKVREQPIDVVVVFIGANDVIRRMRPADSVEHLREVVRALSLKGAAVVVATCPDLGTVQPIPQPLRYIARRASRQLAAAQTIAVVEEGGRTVALSDLFADDLELHPDEMFGPDRFHPSARGYAQAATAVLPSVCAALGLLPESVGWRRPDEDVLPVDRAAVEAAEQAGSEVSPARAAGGERGGPRGLLARLLRRGSGAAPDGATDETDSDSVNATPDTGVRDPTG